MPGSSSTAYANPCGVIGAFRDRLDRDFGGVPNLVLALDDAINRHRELVNATQLESPSRPQIGNENGDWAGIITAVTAISQKLLKEIPSDGSVDQVSIDREVREELRADSIQQGCLHG